MTAGTGSYYCGACMRDNALARELIGRGHVAHLVPMYLPLQLDEKRVDQETPVFFGGIKVFLHQKLAWTKYLPKWLERALNGRKLLEAVARRSHLTSAREQGEMTCQMLNLEESRLGKDFDELVRWLEKEGVPDVFILSNALLAGLIRELKKRLRVPVVCTFQGEDSFLDGLPEPWRTQAWKEMGDRVREADAMVAPSRFYAAEMLKRLGFGAEEIEVIPNGVDLTGYRVSEGRRKRVGYLARMCHFKGLDLLVDAIIEMADPEVEWVIAGTQGGGDEEFVAMQKRKLAGAGMTERVEWLPNVSWEEKGDFLASLDVFCVPTRGKEAFGLYLIEAMACGVPVVMPRASAFPEIVEAAGCGVLVEPEDSLALARGIRQVLGNEDRKAMGERGRKAVEEKYHVAAMADGFEELFGRVLEK